MTNNHLTGDSYLTDEQIIYALSLGDGSLSPLTSKNTSSITISHSPKQLNYLLYKQIVLNSINIETIYKERKVYLPSTEKKYTSHILKGRSCHCIGKVNKMLYEKTGYRRHKKVLKDFSLFTPYALYIFVLDDFTRYGKETPKQWGSFCTENFSEEEQLNFIKLLYKRFNIKGNLHKRKEKFRIYIPKTELQILKEVLKDYKDLVPSMYYKLS